MIWVCGGLVYVCVALWIMSHKWKSLTDSDDDIAALAIVAVFWPCLLVLLIVVGGPFILTRRLSTGRWFKPR